MSAAIPQRSLSLLEKYQVSKQLVHAYGTVTATAELTHPPRHGAGDSHHTKMYYLRWLFPAINKLVHDHPQLCLALSEPESASARFVHLPSFDLAAMVTVTMGDDKKTTTTTTTEETLTATIAEECTTEFDLYDQALPLWRLRISVDKDRSDRCTVVLAVQHVILDGMSLTIFWQDLVRFLNESEFAVSHGFQVKRDPGIISVPLEDCHPPSMAWMDYLKLMWEMTGQKWWHKAAPGPSIWRGDYPAVDGENVMTLVRMAHVEPSTWKAVIQRCKSADISPHAALLAALVLAWGQVWPGYDLETSTPVNARKFCEPAVPANCMGNYTGVYESTWSADQCTQPFWSFAETYHTNLQANKANGVKKSGLLGFLTNYPQDYCQFWYDKRKQNEFGRTGGVELSDLGRVTMNTKTTERWHVDKLWFCQSAQTYTTALGVNSVTLDGHLYLTLCWHKGAVDPTKVDRFLQLMVNQLEQVASATTTSE